VKGNFFSPHRDKLYVMECDTIVAGLSIRDKQSLVRVTQQRLGFPSERTMMDMIRTGMVSNLPISIKDIEDTLNSDGRHIATIQGQSSNLTSSSFFSNFH
jgi:hypothetical protein